MVNAITIVNLEDHLGNVRTKYVNLEEVDNIPPIVFKYRSWANESHKTILTQQIVFLAPPTSFSDPLDCKLFKRYDLLSREQIYNYYLQSSKKHHPERTRQQHRQFARDNFVKSPMHNKEKIKELQFNDFERFDNRFGVLSLTANPSNFSMWDRYSDRHKGFCVGFDSLKMFRHLGGGAKVEYYDQLPDILPFDSFEEELFKQVFSKERKWEFEQEYRTHMIFQQPITDKERKIKLPSECFTQIIFGAEMQEDYQQEIISVCNDKKLNVSYFKETIDYFTETVKIQALPCQ